ncbi:MAG: dephospho-CoA kinase [Bacteroidales bacterium]|nr:dephospho-CoA kinase [Bacteroidales bacterium]
MEATKLNQAQIEILHAMAALNTEEEVRDLKRAITAFFAKRADEAMDKLWESGQWNYDKLQSLKDAHYRTPY